jgi:4-azaleucine resistance transporter AzlC
MENIEENIENTMENIATGNRKALGQVQSEEGVAEKQGKKMKALRAAFPYTLPIFAGFTFLGVAYGIYMRVSGFSVIYPILMSITIFGGSMEFITVGLLLGTFNPLGALILTLIVHARHIFYGISMLDKYKNVGKKKLYLIYGLCDETFSINCATPVPEGIDKGWFYLFVTALNQCYWVLGATCGGLFGSLITVDVKGLEFVMTALLVVIFLNNWRSEKNHSGSCIGLGVTFVSLLIFKSGNFLIPAMIGILLALTVLRKKIEPEVTK